MVIAAALIPFIIDQISKWQNNNNDPKIINKNKYAQIDNDIVSKNSNNLTIGGESDLDELERLQRSKNS
jgi:hypothetical protein